MPVKINVEEELGLKRPITIKVTQKNYRKTLKFQKKMLHLQITNTKQYEKEKAAEQERQAKIDAGEVVEEDEVDDLAYYEELEKSFDELDKAQEEQVEYISDVLYLSEPNVEKLDDMEIDELQKFAQKVIAKVMGIEPEEAKPEDTGLAD
ncbi:hypothetical protein PWO95_06550 [Weissella paramesenteroides]|uniref:hypothetical protein n=1 Tax=Weissella paramesenteroides TaxID=1249 RepID=UPI0023A91A84|nr:hypothetical protein [Weissella paramesenteroides]WEA52300.1 hypothetical protein PWO95_06550 [Weissella paramesenteroides]